MSLRIFLLRVCDSTGTDMPYWRWRSFAPLFGREGVRVACKSGRTIYEEWKIDHIWNLGFRLTNRRLAGGRHTATRRQHTSVGGELGR